MNKILLSFWILCFVAGSSAQQPSTTISYKSTLETNYYDNANSLVSAFGDNLSPAISFGNLPTDANGIKILGLCSEQDTVLRPDISAVGSPILGYTVSSIPYSPPFSLEDVANTTKVFGSTMPDDSWSNIIDLPFSFCFFENTYSEVLVGANGQVTFDIAKPPYQGATNPYHYSNQPDIPFGFNPTLGGYGVRNSIFGVYEDIDPSKCTGDEGVYAGVSGEFPARIFCVSFKSIPLFGNNIVRNSYQTVLYENSNVIDVYVENRDCCGSTNQGKGIIGIINSDGTDGLAAPGRNVSDDWTAQQEAWRFTPIAYPAYSVTWYKGAGVDGEVIGNADTLAIDNFVDTVTIRLQFSACNGNVFDLRDTAIIVHSQVDITHLTDTIFAGEQYVFFGNTLTATGLYSHKLTNIYGCDSIINLSLQVNLVPPAITTLPANNITQNSAQLNSEITAGTEQIFSSGYQYKATADDVWTNLYRNGSTTIMGLQENTEYHFFAFVTTQSGMFSGDTLQFSTLNPSGIVEASYGKINLYPNPVKDELKIENEELKIGDRIDICDITGRLHQSFSILNFPFSINVSALPTGVYFVKIENFTGKFTKE
ncbi:MAG: T9SS type A sorting domain-containing protein [Prevotellaceae bacterium]|jgi:hypothetical protein|nr:T9SS type A sorting domain-containing protein [Prevotellaceae bacterium]